MAKTQTRGSGQSCPHCGRRTYRDKGSYLECTVCGYIGWPWSQPVSHMGKGRENTCPWCQQLTLHNVKALSTGHKLRRCSTCNYTAIEPPQQAQAAAP